MGVKLGLTLREEHRSRMFEPKRKEMAGGSSEHDIESSGLVKCG
jgi:hypothetical protein